jgi:hypothetical protein
MPACEIADLLAKVMELWWMGAFALDAADKREISTLIRSIEDVVDVYPLGPE